MADKSNDPIKTGAAAGASSKRPHATLDLKATELGATPQPAPPSSYATSGPDKIDPKSNQKKPDAGPAPSSSSTGAATSASSTARPEYVTSKKRGGFVSHLAASVIGGVLALAGSEWALPQMGLSGNTSRFADTATALDARVKLLETKSATPINAEASTAIESRLAALEQSATAIADIKDSQSRLVAETKAALASAASDAGEPEQLTRLSSVEDKLKALADAGANDPNAGRLEQLAALTGKVADLETSLATQLTELRKSVAEDVEGRILSATESSEAAKSGTQRIDRDVASVKSDAVRLEESLLSIKTEADKTAAATKLAQEQSTILKSELDALKSTAVKPSDLAASLGPLSQKISGLEQNLQSIMKAESERQANSERIVLALELQNLKRALNNGQNYAAELEDVQKTAGRNVDLSVLAKFKDQGIPSQDELAKEFRTAAYAAIDAETEPADASVVDRLIAGAKSVVRVRKINHTPDDKTTEAIVGRMEMSIKDGRLSEALTQAQDLSPKAQAAIEPFLNKIAARVSIDSAVSDIEEKLKSSLSPSSAPAPTVRP